jgi:hypothetical protein
LFSREAAKKKSNTVSEIKKLARLVNAGTGQVITDKWFFKTETTPEFAASVIFRTFAPDRQDGGSARVYGRTRYAAMDGGGRAASGTKAETLSGA